MARTGWVMMLILHGKSASCVFRLGQLIKYIPHPVVTGFTAGIAVIIASRADFELTDSLGIPNAMLV